MSTHKGTMSESPLIGAMDLRTEFTKVMETMKVNKKVVRKGHIEKESNLRAAAQQ